MLCPSGTDSCVKLYFGGRVADTYVEGFFKECGSKLLCNEYLCKVLVKDGATIDDCEVNCCDDGLCNGTHASTNGQRPLAVGMRSGGLVLIYLGFWAPK